MRSNERKQSSSNNSPTIHERADTRYKGYRNGNIREVRLSSHSVNEYIAGRVPIQKYITTTLVDRSKGRLPSLRVTQRFVVVSIAVIIFFLNYAAPSSVVTSSLAYSDVFVHGEVTSTSGYLGGNNANVLRTKPTLCNDGDTYGYSDWTSLRSAVMEINLRSRSIAVVDDSNWVVDDYGGSSSYNPPHAPKPFVICPGVTIRGRNRRGSIFINSEDVIIECDSCTIDLGGTHLSFGSNAKGVVVRGVTFMGAKSSSLTFHHHGAEATFEDCIWIGNSGINNAGAVADLNSTSSVSFFRCEISDSKQMPRVVGYGNTGVSSSLTIRN